jgi:hypothetical protein
MVENRQPMTSYALGGCHQGKGLTNDVFAMQRRPQFGFCPKCVAIVFEAMNALDQCGFGTKDFAQLFMGEGKKVFKKRLIDEEGLEEDAAKAIIKALDEDTLKNLQDRKEKTSNSFMQTLSDLGKKGNLQRWLKS